MNREKVKAMVTIVNRGDGLALSKLYAQNGALLHTQIAADGTASSELLDMLGLTHSERDLLLSFAPERVVERLLNLLDDDYRGILRLRGIAFSLRLTGVSGAIAEALPTPDPANEPEGGPDMHPEKEYNLILAFVNPGYTDAVMHTAVKAGAKGGTVVRGRWIGTELLEQFHGISIQDEKEVLLIACAKSERNAIMDAVNAEHGLRAEPQAMVCSLPIDRMVRLT